MNLLAARITRNEIVNYGILGRRLQRTIEIEGIPNTSGELETYRLLLDGAYENGAVRFEVQVQRPNGKFAQLNRNIHTQRCYGVLQEARRLGLVQTFLTDNLAA
jgi:hypothetical protein